MSDGVPLSQHWGDIHRYRWLIVLTALAAACFAWAISLAITPVFEAKTTFYLASNAAAPAYVTPGGDLPPEPLFPAPDEKTAALNVGILRGRELQAALAEEFGLPLGELRKRLDVKVSGEFMVDVFFRDPDPVRAAAVSARMPALYAGFHEASMRARATAVAGALAGHLAGLRALSDRRLAEREATRAGFGVPPDDDLVARLAASRAAADEAAAAARAEGAAALARIAGLETELAAEAQGYAAGATIAATPALDAMAAQALALRVDLAGVTEGPQSPRRAGIEGQVAAIEAAAEAERGRIAASAAKPAGSLYEDLRADLARARADAAAGQAEAAAAAERAASAAALLDRAVMARPQAARLAEEIPQIAARIAGAEANLAAAELQAAHAAAPVVIVERAVPPARPAFPVPPLNAAVAALTGAILGCYYALFLGHSRRLRLRAEAGETAMPAFTAEEMAGLSRLFAPRGGEAAHG